MSFSRPIGYHSHADPIWPDGTFKYIIITFLHAKILFLIIIFSLKGPGHSLLMSPIYDI